jgi:hypothetical protein
MKNKNKKNLNSRELKGAKTSNTHVATYDNL